MLVVAVGAVAVGLAVLLARFVNPYVDVQRVMYLLYTRTFLGRVFHQRKLAGARAMAAAHTRDCGRVVSAQATVVPVPFLEDNYAYLLICNRTGATALVDPADPEAVLEAVGRENRARARAKLGELEITHILCTHRHHDHAGGNAALKDRLREIQVVGGTTDAVSAATRHVNEGDVVRVGELDVSVLDVPCHTMGSVAFKQDNFVFVGDFLFSAGAGKFFEGGARTFLQSVGKILRLPPSETFLFPGHEYTVSNLEFAVRVAPHDDRIRSRLAWARAQREASKSTIPTSLAEELTINLFLQAVAVASPSALTARVRELVEANKPVSVKAGEDRNNQATRTMSTLDETDPEQVVRALRALKDNGLPKAAKV